jgi:hypothetical protein
MSAAEADDARVVALSLFDGFAFPERRARWERTVRRALAAPAHPAFAGKAKRWLQRHLLRSHSTKPLPGFFTEKTARSQRRVVRRHHEAPGRAQGGGAAAVFGLAACLATATATSSAPSGANRSRSAAVRVHARGRPHVLHGEGAAAVSAVRRRLGDRVRLGRRHGAPQHRQPHDNRRRAPPGAAPTSRSDLFPEIPGSPRSKRTHHGTPRPSQFLARRTRCTRSQPSLGPPSDPMPGRFGGRASAAAVPGRAAGFGGFSTLDTRGWSNSRAEGEPKIVAITPELIRTRAAQEPQGVPADVRQLFGKAPAYTIGPGDVIGIIVYRHPELMPNAGAVISQQSDPTGVSVAPGFIVDGEGEISFPYIGRTKIARPDGERRLRADHAPDPPSSKIRRSACASSRSAASAPTWRARCEPRACRSSPTCR